MSRSSLCAFILLRLLVDPPRLLTLTHSISPTEPILFKVPDNLHLYKSTSITTLRTIRVVPAASGLTPTSRIKHALTGIVGEVRPLLGPDLLAVDPDMMGSSRTPPNGPPVEQRALCGRRSDQEHRDQGLLE